MIRNILFDLDNTLFDFDKAEALGAVSGGVIISFPRMTDCGIAMDETFRCTENEISAGENTIQMLLESRMFP